MISDELFTLRINVMALLTGLAAMISIDLCCHYKRLIVCVIAPQSAVISLLSKSPPSHHLNWTFFKRPVR